MAVKTGCTPQTQEKDFCLCSPSLWTCLLVVAVSRLNGMVEKRQSAGACAAEFAAEPWRRQRPSVYPIFV